MLEIGAACARPPRAIKHGRASERAGERADRPKSADCVVYHPPSEIYVYDMRDLLGNDLTVRRVRCSFSSRPPPTAHLQPSRHCIFATSGSANSFDRVWLEAGAEPRDRGNTAFRAAEDQLLHALREERANRVRRDYKVTAARLRYIEL